MDQDITSQENKVKFVVCYFCTPFSVGLVKFFGNLAITDSPQQVCEMYPAFQNKVFEMALDPDPVMVGVALDTLGLLGSTVEGKQVLQKTGECGKLVSIIHTTI